VHRLVQGVWWGREVLLDQVPLNFSFRNKFIIVLPCGLLVDNNTFSKMCIFRGLAGYPDEVGYENRNTYVFIIIHLKAMKSLCWFFKLFFVA
jgi:hypothetical protein